SDTVQDALALRATLKPGQVTVTRDGVLVGPNWIKLPGAKSRKLGLLAREEEIRFLERRIEDFDTQLETLGERVGTLRGQLQEQEQDRNLRAQALTRCNREHADLQNRLGQREARYGQLRQRLERFETDRDEIEGQIGACVKRIGEAREMLSRAEQAAARYEAERGQWRERREQLTAEVEAARTRHQERRDGKYDADTQWQIESSRLRSLEESLRRLETRRQEMLGQTNALSEALTGEDNPEDDLQTQLQQLLTDRERIESELNVSRQESERVNLAIQEDQQQVVRIERDVEQRREMLNQQQLRNRETELRQQNLAEQIAAGRYDLDTLANDLPEDASEDSWRERIEHVGGKIDRIGPVNLVAIDEFEEQSERKTYLDAQHADLVEALETLEGVIRKIDRETRQRFKETFDKLNAGFQKFFPQLFGGGSAVLELTDNDFLTTGVTVMARPPGKRNSTIHLLSGGEKALTAVSLLFSLFQLNPAPFCLLDEVDAPLDDANVERYCKTLRSLSEKTQLLVITHNKITMEAADILVGVTMSEPGVSRMVSVDIQQAVQMAAS
ncbi:MAG: chromosome segregation protein SMC, partial [Proteobacteria bacterium]